MRCRSQEQHRQSYNPPHDPHDKTLASIYFTTTVAGTQSTSPAPFVGIEQAALLTQAQHYAYPLCGPYHHSSPEALTFEHVVSEVEDFQVVKISQSCRKRPCEPKSSTE